MAAGEVAVTVESGAVAHEAGDVERRFGGLARLYGVEGAARIRAAHVAVVGIGGVGSWAAEALARSGVGRLTLIDLDHVAESNVNRQVHALTDTLGQAKVQAMRERIAQIHPTCVVHGVEEFVDADNWPQLLPAPVHAVIALEEIAHRDTASRLIGIDTDKDRATIRRPDRGLGQNAPDGVGLLVPGVLHRIPDLFLTREIRVHREGHELFQRHAILGIDLEQGRGHRGEFQPLLHDLRCHEEGCRDRLLTLALLLQCNKGAELIEWMQGDALHVLSQGVVLGQNI